MYRERERERERERDENTKYWPLTIVALIFPILLYYTREISRSK